MAQIIQISTQYQLANVVALIRAGHLGEAKERRILVIANNSFAPELTPAADDMPGSAGLLTHFDLVVDWNAAIWPNHPKAFGISGERAPIMQRSLRSEWAIADDEPIDLLVESLPGHPAGVLTQIFTTAMISVHSDGLMSYGPIRNPLSLPQYQRLQTIYYTDLLPGITPRQLAEHSPDRVSLPPADLKSVIEGMAAEVAPELAAADLADPIPNAGMVLGQYLAQIDLITAEEELDLHLQMIDEVKARGLSTVIFKPHPTSARTTIEPLRKRSHELGLEFVLADVPLLAEIVIATTRPQLVVSCYSTGLATARALFGTATAAIGTSMMLEVLTPYQNSNRIPLTIVDALHTGGYVLPGDLAEVADPPANASSGTVSAGMRSAGTKDLGPLIDAVTYCMQSETASYLRGNAIDFLESALGGDDMKYFKRKRLSKLDLPGQLEISPPRRGLSSAKRRLRTQAKRAQHTLKSYGISIDGPKLVPKVKSTLGSKLGGARKSEPNR
ncbi:alpha-2,8-polysialyltransferase family protein [Brevibacterium sp. ZH18]|uniref:alpha-2,8-polysialyltransferase family protein n=1 Tax=Brevibacterium sp. ZH18 TaxID=2927784 RepID=UPI001F623C4E|nr:alpha-2,8-polysialyltransferase family protein [Brevibacterium sp. ZH18]MCI4012932.1 alpha-2,8-polysialyltransferase family protein [Brevibacterium sp. ZH18]